MLCTALRPSLHHFSAYLKPPASSLYLLRNSSQQRPRTVYLEHSSASYHVSRQPFRSEVISRDSLSCGFFIVQLLLGCAVLPGGDVNVIETARPEKGGREGTLMSSDSLNVSG